MKSLLRQGWTWTKGSRNQHGQGGTSKLLSSNRPLSPFLLSLPSFLPLLPLCAALPVSSSSGQLREAKEEKGEGKEEEKPAKKTKKKKKKKTEEMEGEEEASMEEKPAKKRSRKKKKEEESEELDLWLDGGKGGKGELGSFDTEERLDEDVEGIDPHDEEDGFLEEEGEGGGSFFSSERATEMIEKLSSSNYGIFQTKTNQKSYLQKLKERADHFVPKVLSTIQPCLNLVYAILYYLMLSYALLCYTSLHSPSLS